MLKARSLALCCLGRRPKETPDMIIDAPFLVWFMRPLLNKPLFVGYIATEDWKNPGSIH